uniref:RING-type domain-containing protein n=1 Tax=Sinocyclocheilus anshuiensis TaxID=1608454 RepID=A0A671MSK6_9TELE
MIYLLTPFIFVHITLQISTPSLSPKVPENNPETSSGIFVNQEQFSCPICMDLLRDPVTIPCGHNYCKECIKSYWEQKNQKKLCSCPECRQTFSPRPALNKNTLFAEVVEKLRQTGMRSPTIPGVQNHEIIAKEKQDLVIKSFVLTLINKPLKDQLVYIC